MNQIQKFIIDNNDFLQTSVVVLVLLSVGIIMITTGQKDAEFMTILGSEKDAEFMTILGYIFFIGGILCSLRLFLAYHLKKKSEK